MPFFSATNLSYKLENKTILNSVSFSLEKGSLTLLCGQNGSGKSMILKAIKGLIKIDSGVFTLEGVELKRKERMKKLGLVFQDVSLSVVGQTVYKDIAFGLENLGFSSIEIKRRTEELLERFSLTELQSHSPSTLSGGELRRLAIAGVLAMEPEVILLDEPFANLDYPSTLLVLESLIKLKNEGVTLLVVSHEVEKLLALSDHLLILNKGELKYDGEPEAGIEKLKENQIYVPAIPFKEMTWLC